MEERKTALILSGGGSRGAYEIGVWQAITELGIKIDIVAGVSVGAINAAMVTTGDVVKTCNLWRNMQTDMIFDVEADAKMQDYAKEFLVHQGAGTTGLQQLLNQYIDEKTMRESPMDFGLLTVEFPSMTPHYLWKEDIPEGQIADYITASASAFPAVHAHKIDDKEFIDGGYHDNLPLPMANQKGATHTIAVNLDAIGKFRPKELDEVPNLTYIKSKWNLGDFLVFDTENTARILRLGYLDTMKVFEVYDGEYYTFVHGVFDQKSLVEADAAARIFKLDPLVLYRKEMFLSCLAQEVEHAVKDVTVELQEDLNALRANLKPSKLSIGSLANMTKIKEVFKIANRKTVALIIAENIQEKGKDSIFLSKYAKEVMATEIHAALFLLKHRLVKF
ncbi:NTE family protein [Clostridiales Family XIII bacterium PM5-7]